VVAGCGGGGDDNGGGTTTELDPVTAAQRRVDAAEAELADAQAAFADASTAFCDDSKSYIESVDRYGSVLTDEAVTVGDVTTAGADLEQPREAVQSSADDVLAAHERVGKADQELADAQAALDEAESGTSAPDEPETTTTTEPLVPDATVDRVKTAEDDLHSAFEGVTPDTPLTDATAQVNAAAFALQVAWLRLFVDAGCLAEGQQAPAVEAVAAYTTALQTDLTTAGYLAEGGVDGIYGPATVDAVEELQRDSGLPVTGFVDRATSAALDAAVEAAGGAAATQAVADTAALQATLTLAGYWTGPIDGQWTDALTAALASLQTDLGVPATGVVDAATLEAMQRAIEEARTPPTTEPPARDSGGDTETTEESSP
jgi:peptidoglycan hydrolase-like protein with peptidoglycan-binding domain